MRNEALQKRPKSWATAERGSLSQVQGVCLDIDDTLSTSGKLTAEAFQALWDLKNAGFNVVPITGRPAGWCDLIARFWPVNAVIGENGAFTFFMQNGVRKRIDTPAGRTPQELKGSLHQLSEEVKSHFPEAQWASDQSYREYDLAIDICEDVKPWQSARVNELLELCHKAGAHAKLSSIHVNTWFGEYDKRKGFEFWISQGAPGADLSIGDQNFSHQQWLFIGDSPNDEPLFQFFANSVGVANLEKYLDRLKYPPIWITQSESGAGFVEMARKLIDSRQRK